ncbi:MAG: GNAT family N-acetyltransferase [Sedimentisphaerales bacterium]|nr:GNAT family N-acetyltransferase [Sedimentisphaerales bacterium]
MKITDIEQFHADSSNSPAGSLFTSYPWVRVLKNTFPLEYIVVDAEDTSEGLVFVQRNDLLGPHLVSLPFTDYTHPALKPEDIFTRLEFLATCFPQYQITIRLALEPNNPSPPAGWEILREAVFYEVPVLQNEENFSRFTTGCRGAVKQAGKLGTKIRHHQSLDAIHRFYDLYALHRQIKFHILSPPLAFFENIHKNFFPAGNGWIFEASHEGELLASVLILRHGETLYYKYSAANLDNLKFRPNHLILQEVLNLARDLNCRTFNLGLCWLTDDDKGLRFFKKSFGSIKKPVTIYQKTPPDYNGQKETDIRTLLRNLTDLLVNCNLSVEQIDQAGKLLFHYFM